jgi:hypothetical protein
MFTALKNSKYCPLVLLVKTGWRQDTKKRNWSPIAILRHLCAQAARLQPAVREEWGGWVTARGD